MESDLMSFSDGHEVAEKDTIYNGRISHMPVDKNFGFVDTKTPLPVRFTKQGLYFRWRENDSSTFKELRVNQAVQFKIDEKCDNDRPSLKELLVIDGDFARELPIAVWQYKYNNQSRQRNASRGRSGSQTRTDMHGRSRSHSRGPPNRGPLVAIDIAFDASNSDTIEGKPTKPSAPKGSRRLTGVVCDIKNNNFENPFGFIKPDTLLPSGYKSESDVRFFFRDVTPSSIQPQKGDKVEFVLGGRDKTKAHAVRVYIKTFATERSSSEIEQVLRNLVQKVSSLSSNAGTVIDGSAVSQTNTLVDIVGGLEVWRCIGNCRTLSDKAIQILMKLVDDMKKICLGLRSNFVTIVEALSETFLFDVRNGSLTSFVTNLLGQNAQDTLGTVRQFLTTVTELVPNKIGIVAALVKPMISSDKNSLEYFLSRVLKLALKTNDPAADDQEWDDLPMVPSSNEMLHGPLEGAFNLQPIRPTGAYESAEQYLDIYFRLLRADCFSALNKGIRALLHGKLDHRDMHAYHSLQLYGIQLNEHDMPITLALKLAPFKPVRNWVRARNLMYGNLLCISVSGTFRDAIWATVVSRDLLEDKQIVMLELCSECNTLSDALAMEALGYTNGMSVMVESPTYYRAYQPVLRSLQSMGTDHIPFVEEIVNVQKSEIPSFLYVDTTIDGRVIYHDATVMDINEFISGSPFSSKLDQSQTRAFRKSVSKRVAIIQGPPGTGKTFIGVKLVQALNSLSTKPHSPILILTYKNHALDEFMKQMNLLYPDKIARIGGRQQDSELAHCNLSELRKERKSKVLFDAIMDMRSDIDTARSDVTRAFKHTKAHRELSAQTFIAYASSGQLQSLVRKCWWSDAKLPSTLRDKDAGSDEFQTVTKGKKGRNPSGPLVNNEEVEYVLSALGDSVKEILCDDSNRVDELSLQLSTALKAMIDKALQMWLPNRSTFDKVRDTLNASFCDDLSKLANFNLDDDAGGDAQKGEEDGDEEDTKAEEDERIAATGAPKGLKVKFENIIKLQDQTASQGQWMPTLFPMPDDYRTSVHTTYLLNKRDLWSLTPQEKVIFVQNILHSEYTNSATEFVEELVKYKALFKSKSELETSHSINILANKKVVGMTITGASIYSDLIAQLKPQIVLVEEAGEVMESQLLSCLGPWVQQLILIGDHKQLRPNVESYELKRDFHLDLSLMERLINNGLDFSTLALQNRMRPEFAEMLKDIYPKLESNYERVANNRKPPSSVESMFFWTHAFPDSKQEAELQRYSKQAATNVGRSCTNEEEANRCVNLAVFFIQQGHEPTEITILGAYLGQVHLLRRKMRDARQKYIELFGDEPQPKDADSKMVENKGVVIQTIDNYQGDENNIVIVSLVRSNDKGKTGFLHSLNRRCVAQSRAKCAMYFIGNADTIGTSHHWNPILNTMKEKGLLDTGLALRCPDHATTQIVVKCATDIALQPFCKRSCQTSMPCHIHPCQKPCQPKHRHDRCTWIVPFTFNKCGHQSTRECFEKQDTKKCLVRREFLFPCLHKGEKCCHEDHTKMICRTEVVFAFPCKHKGNKLCHEDERLMLCKEKVTFFFNCGHCGIKVCHEDHTKMICRTEVIFEFPCQHKSKKICHEDETRMLCKKQVTFVFNCGHSGTKVCYESERLKKCTADVQFIFPCGHRGKKQCGEDESLKKCIQPIVIKFDCGHLGGKMCYQPRADKKCDRKCTRVYSTCKHPCSGVCSEPCNPDACIECARIQKATEEARRQAEEKQRKHLLAEVDKEIASLKSRISDFSIETLSNQGHTAAEYLDVYDMVVRYIQPMHNWFPKITKIEKVSNATLLIKFLQCKQKMFDPFQCQKKFHGTTAVATASIIKEGFRMPAPNDQMYGPGVYFATDSSKSAQEIYTKGSGMLLLCEVLLGRPYTATTARKDMIPAKLKALRCDSLFAPRGSAVRNDEFVVYDPNQALPKYVIHYTRSSVGVQLPSTAVGTPVSQKPQMHNITPKRTFDPNDQMQMHFRVVESQFHRLRQKYSSRQIPDIKSIDYYINPPLVAQYDAKQSAMKSKHGNAGAKAETVLAFHGTSSQQIDNIVKNNFDMTKIKRTAHGHGMYFSEFPEVSLGYGNGLLLCCVLPGNAFVGSATSIPPNYDSIAVGQDSEGRAQMLVINDSHQILPCYVIHF